MGRVSDIDGGVVRLKLEGACGTCPSSTMTMKMGLERGLREKIPEIVDVVQDMGEGGPDLSPEAIETVLDTVRPFLNVAGGTIELDDLRGVGGMQPTIILKMGGKSAALRSVKTEIMQRLQRNFMISGLRIEWVKSVECLGWGGGWINVPVGSERRTFVLNKVPAFSRKQPHQILVTCVLSDPVDSWLFAERIRRDGVCRDICISDGRWLHKTPSRL